MLSLHTHSTDSTTGRYFVKLTFLFEALLCSTTKLNSVVRTTQSCPWRKQVPTMTNAVHTLTTKHELSHHNDVHMPVLKRSLLLRETTNTRCHSDQLNNKIGNESTLLRWWRLIQYKRTPKRLRVVDIIDTITLTRGTQTTSEKLVCIIRWHHPSKYYPCSTASLSHSDEYATLYLHDKRECTRKQVSTPSAFEVLSQTANLLFYTGLVNCNSARVLWWLD